MFDNLLTRITSPSTRRRHTYHCPEVHSDPEDNEPVITNRKPRLLERRKKGRRALESGLRQARSLGRLDGLKEVRFLFFSLKYNHRNVFNNLDFVCTKPSFLRRPFDLNERVNKTLL